MKWTVLVDNRTNDPSLATEHGLSILLETESKRILLDTGASDLFIRNAERLGKDLSSVDYVFISHGHSDHAGGLKHFMEINKTARVIVSPDSLKGRFYSKRKYLHSITTTWPDIPKDRWVLISESCQVLDLQASKDQATDDLRIIAHIPHIHPMPKGNQHLFVRDANGEYVGDDFRHELALYTDGFLFTGCAHSGLENILAACPYPVKYVVGGFHLLDGQELEEELLILAERLKEHYPTTQFYTSHCTGDNVFEVMKSVMGQQLQSFRCGIRIK